MRVTVIGAGVVGVATAYYLALDGHDVTVIDERPAAGSGTSFANGGQLSYSFSDALGSPEFVRSLPRLMLHRDTGARVALSPGLIRWGIRLLMHSSRRRADESSLRTYREALRSAELMQALREDTKIEFDFRASGKMILISGNEAIRRAKRTIKLKSEFGCDNVVLSGREAVDVEPALAAFTTLPEACIYSTGDQVGDAHRFSVALSRWLERETNCEFLFGIPVRAIKASGGRVVAVEHGGDDVPCDAVVVCAGTGSNALVHPLGLRLPIRAMRGYSVTLPTGDASPTTSITALDQHFVFSRLGDRVRIAGFADFIGDCDEQWVRQRTDELLRTAGELAPSAAKYGAAEKHRWSGVRPMTPDSQPIIGATAIGGLYTNTGHGMLGWTLACVSGDTVATLIREGAAA